MNNDINTNETHFRTDELVNKISQRGDALHKNGNGHLNGNGCKKHKIIQSMFEYNDMRIPQAFKPNLAGDKPSVNKYVEILFKGKRKKLYRNDLNLKLEQSQFVILEIENGIDIGTVYAVGSEAANKLQRDYKGVEPEHSVIRAANDEDLVRNNENINDGFKVMERTKQLAEQFNLEMKVTDAEWQFDHQRLTIFFTAPQRIDFRELVKDLARTFRTRIELRQISAREEAKRMGGVGPCGRYLCCSSFACDFCHVTLDHARIQQLSNNVAKLSGFCGRLKCCLLYEHDTYVDAFKKYPPLHSTVDFPEGQGRILKVDIFKDIIYTHISSANSYKVITFQELIEYFNSGKVKEAPRDYRYRNHDIDPDKLNELLELEKEY